MFLKYINKKVGNLYKNVLIKNEGSSLDDQLFTPSTYPKQLKFMVAHIMISLDSNKVI